MTNPHAREESEELPLARRADDLFLEALRRPAGDTALDERAWRELFEQHVKRRRRLFDYSPSHRDFGGEGNRLLSLLPLELQDWYALMPRACATDQGAEAPT